MSVLTLWTNQAADVQVVRLIERDEIDALLGLFDEVVAERDWQPGDALGCDQYRSAYFGLLVNDELAGGLQIAFPDRTGGLSCQHVWPDVPTGPNGRCAHVELLVVHKPFRGRASLYWHLVAETWRYCVAEGVTRLYIETNPRTYALYRRIGWPLQIQGEPRLHWGAQTYLCTLEMAEVAKSILCRAANSEHYHDVVMQAFRLSRRPRLALRPSDASV
ncbi:MAG: GNAT family N-acetyltransferase [Armatimonadetes bacterium]|nr:GNAT family N-acetyltransferase [Armatimonadota bacterium]MDE2205466.1 GNAT family N-acetyltransferase [Armatimonadota bacterium]